MSQQSETPDVPVLRVARFVVDSCVAPDPRLKELHDAVMDGEKLDPLASGRRSLPPGVGELGCLACASPGGTGTLTTGVDGSARLFEHASSRSASRSVRQRTDLDGDRGQAGAIDAQRAPCGIEQGCGRTSTR
jgi:hypothetical protein